MDFIQNYSGSLIAQDMRWLIDDVELDEKSNDIRIRGWIASIIDDFSDVNILFNGLRAADLSLRVSPDLGEFYPGLGTELFRRFVAVHPRDGLELDNGLLRFSLITGLGETPRT
jgi:hypothetical protein